MRSEEIVLGAILTGRTGDIPRLSPDDFIKFRHVAAAVFELHAQDLLFSGQELNSGEITKRAKISYTELSDLIASADPLQYRTALSDLWEQSKRRILAEGQKTGAGIDEIMQRLDALDHRIHGGSSNKTHFFEDYLFQLDERSNVKPRLMRTGFQPLDSFINRVKGGNLIVIGGRPASGKTAFMLQIACDMATRQGLKVLFLSLEVSREENAERLIRRYLDGKEKGSGRITPDQLETGNLNASQWEELSALRDHLENINIVDSDCHRLSEIQAIAQAQHPDALFIDQLSLIQTDPRDTEFERATKATRALKRLAMRLHIPVFLAVQIRRNPNGKDTEPDLSSFKGSGSIEEDADIAVAVHQIPKEDFNQYASFCAMGEDDQPIGERYQADGFRPITLRILKHRNGPTGDVEILFQGSRFCFLPVS